jgi:hypothetical protein
MHLSEVIERLHPLDTIPHPILVLFVKTKRVSFELGWFSYVERLLRGPASKTIRVACSVMYDMVDFSFVLQQNEDFATCHGHMGWTDLDFHFMEFISSHAEECSPHVVEPRKPHLASMITNSHRNDVPVDKALHIEIDKKENARCTDLYSGFS